MSVRKVEGKVHDLDRCRGRGTTSCAAGRFESFARDEFDDGWSGLADLPPFQTEVRDEVAKSIYAMGGNIIIDARDGDIILKGLNIRIEAQDGCQK